MARVAFIVTTCHEFEGVKVLSSVLKTAGHQTDCFITSEERDFAGAVLRCELAACGGAGLVAVGQGAGSGIPGPIPGDGIGERCRCFAGAFLDTAQPTPY